MLMDFKQHNLLPRSGGQGPITWPTRHLTKHVHPSSMMRIVVSPLHSCSGKHNVQVPCDLAKPKTKTTDPVVSLYTTAQQLIHYNPKRTFFDKLERAIIITRIKLKSLIKP